MKTRELTEKVQRIIWNIARTAKCDILDNRRLVLNQSPILYYQPDFVLLKRSSLVIIEIELSTDTRKSITGDIVRAGLVGANTFVGVTKDLKTAKMIEKYGEVFTRRIREIASMKVFGIAATDKKFSDRFVAILQ
ncbi:MAG: hypothetical protein HY432_00845 [Candidatus Liptonbacteria bacterium]|nr:hypothetical protein [Candidatus Liptonbacteria bacterium]